MRFQGMDRNHDGVITRSEWNGNDQSFRNQDWNGDGILSGDEVRTGARRQTANRDWNRDGVVNQQDALIAQRFRAYDRNGDGRVSPAEWNNSQADRTLFARLDSNHDRALTLDEYASGDGMRADSQGGPAYGFTNIDRNGDGWVTRNEWALGDSTFSRIDANRDNRISPYEFQSYATNDNTNYPNNSNNGSDRFTNLDTNRDGVIAWNEWHGTEGEYVRLDANGDSRLNRSEFDGNPTAASRFSVVDTNHDGWLTRNEWRWDTGAYYRMDTDRDNRVSRAEFQNAVVSGNAVSDNTSGTSGRSHVMQLGYERGLSEGRQAGHEDYANGHGWDLDGQTELERADSGYYPNLGAFTEYQAGYREGFRVGYPEGFNQR